MHSILPAGCSQSQLPPQHETGPWPYAGLNPVTRASRLPSVKLGLSLTLGLPLHFTPRCLPSMKLGPGLNLGFCNISTGAQSSYLLTRLLPSTRRVVLPRGRRSRMSPQMLCSKPVSPNRPREQVHHSNAKTRREFISSVLGLKSHPTQGNLTRAPNKGVWRFIYRQFFVSVTGVAGIT